MKKLVNNNAAPKRGKDGYNNSYKYDYIFKAIIHNVNQFINSAYLVCNVYDTTRASTSPREVGSVSTFYVLWASLATMRDFRM